MRLEISSAVIDRRYSKLSAAQTRRLSKRIRFSIVAPFYARTEKTISLSRHRAEVAEVLVGEQDVCGERA
jgi:hypothetical protein